MNKALALALFAAALVLTGCVSDESRAARKAKREANPGECPNVVVLVDAARGIQFAGQQRVEDVAYTAEVTGVELDCRYFGDRPIDASLKIGFAFGRGPKGEAANHTFGYFVAVTRTNLEVIEKAEYGLAVKFDDDKPVVTRIEDIEKIIIPRASETTSGTNFEIVVGLVLTPEQAIFNRSGQSLKFPNL